MNATHDVSPPVGNGVTTVGAFGTTRWITWWLSILTVLTLGLVASFGMRARQERGSRTADRTAAPGAPSEKSPAIVAESDDMAEGPWGPLEIIPITIFPPMEFIWQAESGPPRGVTWHFPRISLSGLNDKLIELRLTDSVQTAIRSMAKLNPAIDGYTVCPDREFVLGLDPEDRAKLYVLLHHSPENSDQIEAFRFGGVSVEEWFGDSPISPETRQLVTPLIYRHGSFLLFSDLRSVEPLLASAEERMALIRAFSRELTMLLKLEVSEDSDIEALVNYWGRGGREKDVRPILESLSRIGGRQSLDVTQLLPPFARQRIYTYPKTQDHNATVSRDCFWTAFNFFSEQPDDRFGDTDGTFKTFKQDYYRIFGNPQFGDVILYADDNRGLIHAAVYIAADIVFTKNGTTTARPWMFVRLEDMKDFYPRTNHELTAYFRPRGL